MGDHPRAVRPESLGRPTVCVVGSGTHFLSGISYYTIHLARALADDRGVSAVLMRKLVPRRLYPGRDRVGSPLTPLTAADVAETFDGVDWYLVPSLPRALRFLRRQRPDVVVLQWWTAAVLPAYLTLARAAVRMGSSVVIEFHEDQDTGEAAFPLARAVARRGLRALVRRSAAFVVHSHWDAARLVVLLGIPAERTWVVPHGPYPMAREVGAGAAQPVRGRQLELVDAADEPVTVLFFGTVRPYKGLEDLVEAFGLLPRSSGQRWRLLVVGETWEGWTLPFEKISQSPVRGEIEVVNRYVTDDEVREFFARADVVALPYHRSSASGPLHLTIGAGLPVVVTAVGGLTEVAEGYDGSIVVPARDPAALAEGIVAAAANRGRRFSGGLSWGEVAQRYAAVLAAATGAPERTEVGGATEPLERPLRGGDARPSRVEEH